MFINIFIGNWITCTCDFQFHCNLEDFRKMVKIFVGKLADATTAQDLRSLFEQCGTVEDAEKVPNKDIGFVRMPDEKEAFLAVR